MLLPAAFRPVRPLSLTPEERRTIRFPPRPGATSVELATSLPTGHAPASDLSGESSACRTLIKSLGHGHPAAGGGGGRFDLASGDQHGDRLVGIHETLTQGTPQACHGRRAGRLRTDAGHRRASRPTASMELSIAHRHHRAVAGTYGVESCASPIAGRSTAMPSATVAAGSSSWGMGGVPDHARTSG